MEERGHLKFRGKEISTRNHILGLLRNMLVYTINQLQDIYRDLGEYFSRRRLTYDVRSKQDNFSTKAPQRDPMI